MGGNQKVIVADGRSISLQSGANSAVIPGDSLLKWQHVHSGQNGFQLRGRPRRAPALGAIPKRRSNNHADPETAGLKRRDTPGDIATGAADQLRNDVGVEQITKVRLVKAGLQAA